MNSILSAKQNAVNDSYRKDRTAVAEWKHMTTDVKSHDFAPWLHLDSKSYFA